MTNIENMNIQKIQNMYIYVYIYIYINREVSTYRNIEKNGTYENIEEYNNIGQYRKNTEVYINI